MSVDNYDFGFLPGRGRIARGHDEGVARIEQIELARFLRAESDTANRESSADTSPKEDKTHER